MRAIGPSLPVRLVVLNMQADQYQGWPLAQAGNGAGRAANSQGIELFAAGWFDHAVQLFKIEAGVAPELRQIEGMKKLKHLGGGLADRQFGRHDCLVEGGADLNPHWSTFL